MSARRLITGLLLLTLQAGCQAPNAAQDPTENEVRLPARGGFDAYLVHHSDVGVWTVECVPLYPHYGAPQIVALDDKGRCIILSPYSGKWTPAFAAHDGQWLGGLAYGDVNPRRAGSELYVGAKRGNIYQIIPHPQGGFDSNIIAYLPGRELHTLVAFDIDAVQPGTELLAFTLPGGFYLLTPKEDGMGFSCRSIEDLPGRIRDALIVKDREGNTSIATVSSEGGLRFLRMNGGTPEWHDVYRTGTGLSRIALGPGQSENGLVLYVTCDDGRVVRLTERADTGFDDEIIYAGPQGPRGIVAGRFVQDPNQDAVVIYGYSKRVELLTREAGDWVAETIFEDTDKGHWMTLGEFDGRNSTDEIVISGYSGNVILLSRPPGYGMISAN